MSRKLLQIRFQHLRNVDIWEKEIFEKAVKDNPILNKIIYVNKAYPLYPIFFGHP